MLLVINSLTLFMVGITFFRAFYILCCNVTTIESWEIEKYVALLSKERKSPLTAVSQPRRRWFTSRSSHSTWLPSAVEDESVSQIFFYFIEEGEHLDRIYLGHPKEYTYEQDNGQEVEILRNVHESLVFSVLTACKGGVNDDSLHLTQLKLMQHSQRGATFAILSFYRAIRRLLRNPSIPTIWWKTINLDSGRLQGSDGECSSSITLEFQD